MYQQTEIIDKKIYPQVLISKDSVFVDKNDINKNTIPINNNVKPKIVPNTNPTAIVAKLSSIFGSTCFIFSIATVL